MFYKSNLTAIHIKTFMRLVVILFIQFTPVFGNELYSPYDKISASEIISEYLANKEYEHKTELCDIMSFYGSDKGNYHNYTTLYYKLFNNFNNEFLNIFELGLGTNNVDVPSNMGSGGKPGASLFGWANYFPNSKVYGADIDTRILFQTEKIATFYCDQRDRDSITDMFSNDILKDVLFDVIIEDGLHEFNASFTFLDNSIEHLKLGGIYIIEDLSPTSVTKFEQIIPQLQKKFKCVEIVKLPTEIKALQHWDDNTLLIIQK